MHEAWKFDLAQVVKIDCSGETGTIIARAESLMANNQYHVRYKAADGHGVEQWWDESALVAA